MWKNTNHLLYQKDILRLKSNRMPSECVILVFPHFNNRRLKVLWECGKVELFSRLFHISIKHATILSYEREHFHGQEG
jgi:hypothetical protein